jgi:hypothetical protein
VAQKRDNTAKLEAQMAKKKDDLQAVREITAALEGFGPHDQERIIRWSRERLNLGAPKEESGPPSTEMPHGHATTPSRVESPDAKRPTDIQTFVKAKNPRTDSQFAATVAYYYRFEAPENLRKQAITKDDLQEACRQALRERFKNPISTLFNAFKGGVLDKGPEKGTFTINSVGENLVAMTLPEADAPKAAHAVRRKTPQVKRAKHGRKPK